MQIYIKSSNYTQANNFFARTHHMLPKQHRGEIHEFPEIHRTCKKEKNKDKIQPTDFYFKEFV